MNNIPVFAELVFTCLACETVYRIDLGVKRENKHNYDCACGSKYLINARNAKVIYIKKDK